MDVSDIALTSSPESAQCTKITCENILHSTQTIYGIYISVRTLHRTQSGGSITINIYIYTHTCMLWLVLSALTLFNVISTKTYHSLAVRAGSQLDLVS